MITVRHLENYRSQRVLWLLEELGLLYDVVHYARDPKTMLAPPALRAVHPLGKSPVVTVEGRSPLAESGAIVETLIERYGAGGFSPSPGTVDFQRYRVLAALRRGLGHAAVAAEAGIRPDPKNARALLCPAGGESDRREGRMR